MRLDLFADYFQVYLQDDNIDLGNFSDAWTPNAVQRVRIAVVPGAIAVGTARNDTVSIDIEIRSVAPAVDLTAWEHVVEASLDIQTGRIVAAGCTDYFPDAKRLPVAPGVYRLRVLYGAGPMLPDKGGPLLTYRLDLWPTVAQEQIVVLKQGPLVWAG
jgi:hypothetical protein